MFVKVYPCANYTTGENPHICDPPLYVLSTYPLIHLSTRKVSDGVRKVSDCVRKVSDSVGKVSYGISKMSDGARKVSDGVRKCLEYIMKDSWRAQSIF